MGQPQQVRGANDAPLPPPSGLAARISKASPPKLAGGSSKPGPMGALVRHGYDTADARQRGRARSGAQRTFLARTADERKPRAPVAGHVDIRVGGHVRSRTHDGGRQKAEDRSEVPSAKDGCPPGADAAASKWECASRRGSRGAKRSLAAARIHASRNAPAIALGSSSGPRRCRPAGGRCPTVRPSRGRFPDAAAAHRAR